MGKEGEGLELVEVGHLVVVVAGEEAVAVEIPNFHLIAKDRGEVVAAVAVVAGQIEERRPRAQEGEVVAVVAVKDRPQLKWRALLSYLISAV